MIETHKSNTSATHEERVERRCCLRFVSHMCHGHSVERFWSEGMGNMISFADVRMMLNRETMHVT